MEIPIVKSEADARRWYREADRILRSKEAAGHSYWVLVRDGENTTVRTPYASNAHRYFRKMHFRQTGVAA